VLRLPPPRLLCSPKAGGLRLGCAPRIIREAREQPCYNHLLNGKVGGNSRRPAIETARAPALGRWPRSFTLAEFSRNLDFLSAGAHALGAQILKTRKVAGFG